MSAPISSTKKTPPPNIDHLISELELGGKSWGMPQPAGWPAASGAARAWDGASHSAARSRRHGVVDIMLGGLPPRSSYRGAARQAGARRASSAVFLRALRENSAQSSMRRERA